MQSPAIVHFAIVFFLAWLFTLPLWCCVIVHFCHCGCCNCSFCHFAIGCSFRHCGFFCVVVHFAIVVFCVMAIAIVEWQGGARGRGGGFRRVSSEEDEEQGEDGGTQRGRSFSFGAGK